MKYVLLLIFLPNTIFSQDYKKDLLLAKFEESGRETLDLINYRLDNGFISLNQAKQLSNEALNRFKFDINLLRKINSNTHNTSLISSDIIIYFENRIGEYLYKANGKWMDVLEYYEYLAIKKESYTNLNKPESSIVNSKTEKYNSQKKEDINSTYKSTDILLRLEKDLKFSESDLTNFVLLCNMDDFIYSYPEFNNNYKVLDINKGEIVRIMNGEIEFEFWQKVYFKGNVGYVHKSFFNSQEAISNYQ